MTKFVVLGRYGDRPILHEYRDTEEEAEALFNECLADADYETVAWGRVVCDGTRFDVATPETVDWFRFIEREVPCDIKS